MKRAKSMDITVRPRRQITLPRIICEQLGIQAGDRLELVLDEGSLIARPKKTIALEALREIREAFKNSGLSEIELQEAGRQVRQEIVKERRAIKA